MDLKLADIQAKCFIMALFIRDDGQRFLLGSGAYEFKNSQQHFSANTMENDVVSVQGNDGYMLAGQVRRPTTQTFDGYIGDASVVKSQIEGYRREFIGFFLKNHFYTVVYVFPDGTAVQRKRGFLVDAPEVKELLQMFPEYHIGLNFEDVNYYKYAEDNEGNEAYTKSALIGLSTVATGGLIWDDIGTAVETGVGTSFSIMNTIDEEQLASAQLKGDTDQTIYTGKNLLRVPFTTKTSNGLTMTANADGSISVSGTATSTYAEIGPNIALPSTIPSGTTLTFSVTGTTPIKIPLQIGGIWLSIQAGGTSVTGTTTSDAGATGVFNLDGFVRGETYDFTIRDLQLERGENATSFEPYVGGVASPNPDYPQEVEVVTGRQVVDIHGKNLLKLGDFSANGITTKLNSDGSITCTGTTTTTYVALTNWQKNLDIVIPAGTYTFSRTGWNAYEHQINLWDSDKSQVKYIVIPAGANSVTETIDFDAHYYTCNIMRLTSGTSLNFTVKLQLESGSLATSFEPYKAQSYEINLGKNLLPYPYVETTTTKNGITFTVNSDGSVTVSGTATGAAWFKLSESMTLPSECFMSGCPSGGSTTKYSLQTSYSGTVSGDYGSGVQLHAGTTDPVWIVVRQGQDFSTPVTFYPQIEKGTSKSSYAPYFEPIELCKIGTYQDYIYKQGEDWYIHKETAKITLDGTETWSSASAYTGYMMASVAAGENHANNEGYCDELINRGSQAHGGYEYVWIQPNANAFYIQILQSRANSLATFKAWLASNPATVYYALATPTDTQITNEGLLEQLENLDTATTYDKLTIFNVSGSLPAILQVEATVTTGGGVVWDDYGAEWEDGSSSGATTVSVDSIDTIFPVWTVAGPANNPTITNLTTGTSLKYSGNVTESQVLKIDMLNKTATLNGTSVIQNVSGEWVEFAPGNNRVDYSTINADAPDSTIEWQEVVG